MRHSEAETLLYEYVREELDTRTRDEIRLHLAACDRCSVRASEISSVIEAIPMPDSDPASSRDEAYWSDQKDLVLMRIAQPAPSRYPFKPSRHDGFLSNLIPRWVFAPAGVALVALLTVLIATPDSEPTATITETDDAASMERYLRQSRSLLVGLNHMEIPDDEAIDLSAERQLSRDLVLRGRSIQRTGVDRESHKLISDLDQIMEHVSATEEAPTLETIRREIRGRNLLIKLRMAEASASAPPVLRVSNGH